MLNEKYIKRVLAYSALTTMTLASIETSLAVKGTQAVKEDKIPDYFTSLEEEFMTKFSSSKPNHVLSDSSQELLKTQSREKKRSPKFKEYFLETLIPKSFAEESSGDNETRDLDLNLGCLHIYTGSVNSSLSTRLKKFLKLGKVEKILFRYNYSDNKYICLGYKAV